MVIGKGAKAIAIAFFVILSLIFTMYISGYGAYISESGRLEIHKNSSSLSEAKKVENWVVKPVTLADTK